MNKIIILNSNIPVNPGGKQNSSTGPSYFILNCTRKMRLFYGIYSVVLEFAVFFEFPLLISLDELVVIDLLLILS